MSTPQRIHHLTPRLRIGLGTALAAFGVLVAIAVVTTTIFALAGANNITAATPITAPKASVGSTPPTRYLGPRQQRAELNAPSPRPAETSGRVSARQIARETVALEAHGYTPVACTISGTLMRNYHTGQSVTVRY